jgi:hypothetical protein
MGVQWNGTSDIMSISKDLLCHKLNIKNKSTKQIMIFHF